MKDFIEWFRKKVFDLMFDGILSEPQLKAILKLLSEWEDENESV